MWILKFLKIILKNRELAQGICKRSKIILNLTVYHHIHIYFDQLDDSLVSPDYPTSDHHIDHLENHPDLPHDNIHTPPNHPKNHSDDHSNHLDDHSYNQPECPDDHLKPS